MFRTSRHFHSIISLLLYQRFYACCIKHLKLFGRTILANNHCAGLVKHYEECGPNVQAQNQNAHAGGHGTGCSADFGEEVVLDLDLYEVLEERGVLGLYNLTRTTFSYSIARALPCLQQLDVANRGSILLANLYDAEPPGQVFFSEAAYPQHHI